MGKYGVSDGSDRAIFRGKDDAHDQASILGGALCSDKVITNSEHHFLVRLG